MTRFFKNSILAGAIFCSFKLLVVSAAVPESPQQKFIRVAVLRHVDKLNIEIRGRYEISDPKTQDILLQGRRFRRTSIAASPGGINIGQVEYPLDQVKLVSNKDVTVHIGKKDKRFRGAIDIFKEKDGRLLVINTVELEDYIRGILYHEVSHRWPLEVFKVQAIAARTYALYRMERSAKQKYDVTNDIYSQVYGGRSAERYRSNLAVDQTKGLVMFYNKKILPAYFHATCGGTTEDVSELWKLDLPPLKGNICEFCKKSPHYRWKKNFRSKDIQEKLNAHGHAIGLIQEIAVLERNASGRIRRLQIKDRSGQVLTVAGKDFREIVGPNVLKSNNYEIVMQGYYFDAYGRGWGHGVGLCQWGAYGMALKKYSYSEILQYYYPGIAIVDYQSPEFADSSFAQPKPLPAE
ncbi:MAG: hypothetical protein A3D10_02860 [Omnitrophica WOR_2 bacterium RIFCSPHIGHO2_02_FULL_48_11]|nr:MAG: hypothetical protein A3D10_02860 [Omnitrophica WOR_2 bacterium RIFCSPHIGHO2_02_FULL_48_11]